MTGGTGDAGARNPGVAVGRGIGGSAAEAGGIGGAVAIRCWGAPGGAGGHGRDGGTSGGLVACGEVEVTIGGVSPRDAAAGAGCGAVVPSGAGSSGRMAMRWSSANSSDTVDIWRAIASNSEEIRASVAVPGSPPNMLLEEVMVRR